MRLLRKLANAGGRVADVVGFLAVPLSFPWMVDQLREAERDGLLKGRVVGYTDGWCDGYIAGVEAARASLGEDAS